MDEKIIRDQKQQNAVIAMLLEQYGGLLQAIVRKYIAGKPQEIEECMDDIVVSIWYHIDDFDGTKKLSLAQTLSTSHYISNSMITRTL